MSKGDINVDSYDSCMVEAVARTKKITIEVEVPEGWRSFISSYF